MNYSVKKVDVVFNKPVDATTFGVDDITVVCQGKKCDLAGVRILSSDNPSVFTIDLADACKTGGYYNLLIDLTSIKDVDGFSGREMKSAAWIQYPDGLVKLSMSVSPAESGSVSPQSGDYEAGEPVTLRAYPEEGYEFVAWQLNGIIVSQSAEYVFTPTDDTEIIANFRLTQHKVEIVFNPEHGEVTGASSGIFAYGTLIDLWANPTEGYEFVHWQDEMGNVLQIGSRYTFTVKEDAVVKALFAEKNTGVGTVADNVVCDIWPNPVRALLHISGDFSKISKVEFTDINGRHVKIYKDIPTDMPLNVESLPQGIYILRIFTDKGISTHRLVKL